MDVSVTVLNMSIHSLMIWARNAGKPQKSHSSTAFSPRPLLALGMQLCLVVHNNCFSALTPICPVPICTLGAYNFAADPCLGFRTACCPPSSSAVEGCDYVFVSAVPLSKRKHVWNTLLDLCR